MRSREHDSEADPSGRRLNLHADHGCRLDLLRRAGPHLCSPLLEDVIYHHAERRVLLSCIVKQVGLPEGHHRATVSRVAERETGENGTVVKRQPELTPLFRVLLRR